MVTSSLDGNSCRPHLGAHAQQATVKRVNQLGLLHEGKSIDSFQTALFCFLMDGCTEFPLDKFLVVQNFNISSNKILKRFAIILSECYW